jgi:superoxide dismutase, Fe-Mn family
LLTRREALATIALGTAAIVVGSSGLGNALAADSTSPSGEHAMSAPLALAGNNATIPLPYLASSLNGLSERMITSHHENNYGGAVRNLNRIEQELAKINADTPPPIVAALRDRELTFRNSKTLHEAYFANLGGNGRRSGAIESEIAAAYGTTARWEEHMRLTALGLGGGSGWAILAYELDTGALRTVAGGNHTQVLATSVPLLVLDMYEHSYQMDFGAAAAKYVDAFFVNVNWDEANQRLERARRASAALKGPKV